MRRGGTIRAGRAGRTRWIAIGLFVLSIPGCLPEADDSAPPPPVDPAEQDRRDRVVVAALSAIDSTTLPWPFLQSFMVNSTVSGSGDPFALEGDVQESPLDLLGIQQRGFGICTACADSTRLAHAWVTFSTPIQSSPSDWVVPYTMSVRGWETFPGEVTVRCLGGACRPIEGALDTVEVPTPSCCPVFVRVVRPRR